MPDNSIPPPPPGFNLDAPPAPPPGGGGLSFQGQYNQRTGQWEDVPGAGGAGAAGAGAGGGIPPPPAGFTLDAPPGQKAAAPTDEDTGYIPGVERGAKGIVTFPWQVVKSAFMPAQTPEENAWLAATQGTGLGPVSLAAKRLLFDPQYEQWRKAMEETPMPGDDQWNNATERKHMHLIAAFTPIVGPMAANLVDRALKGDVTGALGEMTAYGAGSYLHGAAPGVAARVGEAAQDLAVEHPGVVTGPLKTIGGAIGGAGGVALGKVTGLGKFGEFELGRRGAKWGAAAGSKLAGKILEKITPEEEEEEAPEEEAAPAGPAPGGFTFGTQTPQGPVTSEAAGPPPTATPVGGRPTVTGTRPEAAPTEGAPAPTAAPTAAEADEFAKGLGFKNAAQARQPNKMGSRFDEELAKFRATPAAAPTPPEAPATPPDAAPAAEAAPAPPEEAPAAEEPKAEAPTQNLYRPMLRPAGFATLPSGLKWDYVEAPNETIAERRGLPVSEHPFGVISTDRPLTPDEIEHFDLQPVKPAEPAAAPPEEEAAKPGEAKQPYTADFVRGVLDQDDWKDILHSQVDQIADPEKQEALNSRLRSAVSYYGEHGDAEQIADILNDVRKAAVPPEEEGAPAPPEHAPWGMGGPVPRGELDQDVNLRYSRGLSDSEVVASMRENMAQEASGIELEKERERFERERSAGRSTKGMQQTVLGALLQGEEPPQWTKFPNWKESAGGIEGEGRDSVRIMTGTYAPPTDPAAVADALAGRDNTFTTLKQYENAKATWEEKMGGPCRR